MAARPARAARASKEGDGAKRGRKGRKPAAPGGRGLPASEVAGGTPPAAVATVEERVGAAKGRVLARYRDPLGGGWLVLAVLPVEAVEPTPYQRDLSETHVARLAGVLDRLDRYLDPVIAVPRDEGGFFTPNGNHRLAAMKSLGARSIVALVVPEKEIAFRILALNTEKAHNVREKSLEVIRMARELARLDPRPETEFETEFEEPTLLTLGMAYEQRGRFSGGAYQPVLRRVDRFLPAPLPESLETRAGWVERLLALDDEVVRVVGELKERGFESPYLKAFVLARVNPLRFAKRAGSRSGPTPEVEATLVEVLAKMLEAARRFDAAKVKVDQVARAAGSPPDS